MFWETVSVAATTVYVGVVSMKLLFMIVSYEMAELVLALYKIACFQVGVSNMGGAVLLLLWSIVPSHRGACHLAFWSFLYQS